MTAVSPLPSTLRDAFTSGEALTGSGTRAPLSSNISLDEAALLYDLVRQLRPTDSAEIGLAQGISTLAILQALHDNDAGTHHVADPFQANYDNAGLAMIKAAGLDARFRFHETFAEKMLPDLPALQFVFIDSSHLFDLTIAEFVLADKRLAPGGVVAFHDTWMPAVRKVIRYILANRAYRIRCARPARSWKTLASRAIRALPGATRVFTPELLQPWSTLGVGNLAMLEKVENDQRDWQFYARF